MTEKQKQAVLLINDLRQKQSITNDEYMSLLEFIVNEQQQTQYVPYPTPIEPIAPSFPRYPWEGPWVTYQTSSTSSIKKPSYDK